MAKITTKRKKGTVVLTGASSGLGKVLALELAGAGYRICALARNADKLADLVKKNPGMIAAYAADVTDYASVESATAKILKKHKSVDVLINNAGIFHTAPFHEESVENIDKIIDTNLKGPMFCTRAVAPSMVARKRGRIINISSVSGINGIPGQAIYGASKHGLQGFADVIGYELREHGVLVTNLCPGGIQTPLWGAHNPYPGESDCLTRCEEIAALVVHILQQPDRTLYKKVVFFPKTEWHSDD